MDTTLYFPILGAASASGDSLEAVRTLAYIISAIFFVVGLKKLGKTATARQGNTLSAIGMLIAVVATLVDKDLGWGYIVAGLVIGSAIGVIAAKRVQMTEMPEMVALFNGSGGIASLLVAWAEFNTRFGKWNAPQAAKEAAQTARDNVTLGNLAESAGTALEATVGAMSMPPADPSLLSPGVLVPIALAALIGGLTFTGSLIAYGKLSGKVTGKPVSMPGQNILNAGLLVAAVVLSVLFCLNLADGGPIMEYKYAFFIAIMVISLILGILAVISIGGADMPVVISLLNSYSGVAACAAGFIISNTVLIVSGSLVGASGIILTVIMCKAMNRSLANVLFSGFGSATAAKKAGNAEEQGEANPISVEDAFLILEAASSVIIVPGYGMAVAQAQHAVKELGVLLEENGCDVRYAIHPVAGRMPGHMNVLLAEASVPYEQLVEPDDVNPTMETVDVAIVIGANDVVNPAATDDESSPIYGMPIIEVHHAKTCFVLKRSLAAGYAQIENPLFFKENTRMLFGDAKATVSGLVGEFKEG